jgi:linoleoyl-CoA desaturase
MAHHGGSPPDAPRLLFPARDGGAFAADVKREVEAYFEQRGLSPKANAAMVAKTAIVLGGTVACYLAILVTSWPPLAKLLMAVVMGVGVAGIGFVIVHDANHDAYSHRPGVNLALGRLMDVFGASAYLWRITHNLIHHTYTNIEGIDEDLTLSPDLRLSPSGRLRPIHRWQHLYGFLAYAGSSLFLVFSKDYRFILKRDLGPYRDVKHPAREIAIMVAAKLAYYGWSIVLPLVVLDLPWWQVLIGYLAMHVTAGFIIGVVTMLGHVVEGPEYPAPGHDGRMHDTWAVHEMRTTANFAPRNPVINWYVGGLNFQIEHHLFPKICSIHYPAIAPIVASVARRSGVPYHCHPTFMSAVRSHYRMLRALGPEAWANRTDERGGSGLPVNPES